jgi:D-alanyl-D-alanine carboxypeptidase
MGMTGEAGWMVKRRFWNSGGIIIVMRVKILGVVVILALIAGGWYGWSQRHQTQNTAQTSSAQSKVQQPKTEHSVKKPHFNKNKHAIDNASSLWAIANKHRPLNPLKYQPKLAVPNVPLRLGAKNPEMHLNPRAIKPLEQLFAAAKRAGYHLQLASGYRSYQEQVIVYDNEVKNYGKTQADRESARPGHSEHQLGLSADVEPTSRTCEVSQCFGNTDEGKWLAKNAYQYGFVIRYPKGYEKITGYEWEPWHIRYVGTYLSDKMHKTGTPTLEQFFGLPAAPTYQ